MSLVESAKIYTDLVKAEREIPAEEHHAKDQINALRTKYHQALMAKMREEGTDFWDAKFELADSYEGWRWLRAQLKKIGQEQLMPSDLGR